MFFRYVAAVVKKSVDQKQRGSIIDRAQGIKKRCKILFFVGNTEKSHIHILLECVEWDKVKEITKRRQSLGFHLISDWISKDLYLEPYNTVLVVEMKGKFKIPKESGFKQRKITFLPLAQDNYEHIVAELDDKKMSAHGIVSIFQNNQLLYEIFYDPVRSIKVAPICPKPNLKKAHLKHVKCLDEAGKLKLFIMFCFFINFQKFALYYFNLKKCPLCTSTHLDNCDQQQKYSTSKTFEH